MLIFDRHFYKYQLQQMGQIVSEVRCKRMQGKLINIISKCQSKNNYYYARYAAF